MIKLEDVKKYGTKYQGGAQLIKHLEGETLTAFNSIKAKCYDCMGFYADGMQDCENPTCPLYPFMPFNPTRKKKAANNPKPTFGVPIHRSPTSVQKKQEVA